MIKYVPIYKGEWNMLPREYEEKTMNNKFISVLNNIVKALVVFVVLEILLMLFLFGII